MRARASKDGGLAIAASLYSASSGPSPFEARPAEEAGLAPQGDGKGESLAAAGSTVNREKTL